MRTPTPPVLRRISSDEYEPLPWRPSDRRALARIDDVVPDHVRRLRQTAFNYIESRRGTAATLRAIDAEAGGGFYDIPADAEIDADSANHAFRGRPDEIVIDVQTHLAMPSRMHGPFAESIVAFLEGTDPDTWYGGVHPQLLSAAEWAAKIFGTSETAVAVLTSTPGRPGENVVTNPEIKAAGEIMNRYGGSGRVLTHTIVHPNIREELDAMQAWRDELSPNGWKVYTMWDPPERGDGGNGWFLDDEEIGIPFLERVRDLGPRLVAIHKGIGGPIPGSSVACESPRDIGPAAKRFPELALLVYHSGYEPDPDGEEGPYTSETRDRGVNRLVASLEDAGVPAGSNVYAELGSTWFMMMRKPREAAHVLGKLLNSVGPDRIVWGTDCVWYGSPQPLIDAFRAFTIPERMQEEFGYPALTTEIKEKILSRNASQVYGIDLDQARATVRSDHGEWIDAARARLFEELV